MNRSIIAAAALAVLASSGARAADAPAADAPAAPAKFQCLVDAKPVDPELMAAALDLQSMNTQMQQLDGVIDAVVPVMVAGLRKSATAIPKETLDAFAAEVRSEMKADIPEVLNQTACVLARHYTLSDMRELKAFYVTPIGQKSMKEGAGIASEMFAVGVAWSRTTGTAAAQRVIEKLRAKGMKI